LAKYIQIAIQIWAEIIPIYNILQQIHNKYSRKNMIKLSYKAIQTMMFEGNGKNDQYVVETSNFKSKAGYLTFEIKD